MDFPALFARQQAHFHAEVKFHTPARRRKKLERLKEAFLNRRQQIYDASLADLNRGPMETEVTDFLPVLLEITHAIKHMESWAKPTPRSGGMLMIGTSAYTYPEPKGVAYIIAPWNFPIMLALNPVISAVAAGNCFILKPSELAPHSSALLKSLLAEVFSEEEAAVIEGDGAVAAELSKLPFDHVFFTGSTAVGKMVMRAAAEHLSPVTLELGGVNPAVVDKSADLRDTAEKVVWSKLYNCGQACVSVNDLWVHTSVHDDLMGEIEAAMVRMYGPLRDIQDNPDYCRIVHPRHVARIEKIRQETVAAGGKEIVGAAADAANRFVPPVVIDQAPFASAAFQEEIFGPVLAVKTWEDESQLWQSLRSRPKPLSAYAFTRSERFFERFLANVSSGSTCLNEVVLQFAHLELPFGGIGASGMGRAHGQAGFMAFSNERSVLRQRTGLTNGKLFYPPYKDSFVKILEWVDRYL